MKLTKKNIESFQYIGPAPRRDVRWDETVSGLGLRIYPSGKKVFIISYRCNNRKHLTTLGEFGILTLDQARKLARRQLADVLSGINPQDKKNKFLKDKNFKALCEAYISGYAKIHKKTWKEDERRINRHLIPKWGSRPASLISHVHITLFHQELGKSAPYEANRIIRLLSKIFGLASQWGFVDETYFNPAKNIKQFKEEKRDRWINSSELKMLMQSIKEELNVSAKNFIWMSLLTGARKTELLTAKWSHIDWDRTELKLPETKNGKTHYIPLSKIAIDFIKKIEVTPGNPYIFPGHIKNKHLVNVSKPWKRVCKKAGLEGICIHDLRRTVGSWLAQSGSSLHLIGTVLNHTNQSTTMTYARYAPDQRREALENHSEKLMEAITTEK